jgi:hypothetical protein
VGKQLVNRTKEILGVLLVFIFVASLTAATVSAYLADIEPVQTPIVEAQPVVVGGYYDGYYGEWILLSSPPPSRLPHGYHHEPPSTTSTLTDLIRIVAESKVY